MNVICRKSAEESLRLCMFSYIYIYICIRVGKIYRDGNNTPIKSLKRLRAPQGGSFNECVSTHNRTLKIHCYNDIILFSSTSSNSLAQGMSAIMSHCHCHADNCVGQNKIDML